MEDDAKRVQLLIRVDGYEKAAFKDAAKAEGLTVAAWARQGLRKLAGMGKAAKKGKKS